jgi:hypothetical protein
MMEMHKCNSLLCNNVLQLLQFGINITTKVKLPSGKKVVPPEAQKPLEVLEAQRNPPPLEASQRHNLLQRHSLTSWRRLEATHNSSYK